MPTDRLATGELKFAVIDPRLSKIAGKAWKWLPNKPGTEGAIALALIQWVIANQRYDARYLALANKAAAKAAGEPTWSNAAWLVKTADGKPGKFVIGMQRPSPHTIAFTTETMPKAAPASGRMLPMMTSSWPRISSRSTSSLAYISGR